MFIFILIILVLITSWFWNIPFQQKFIKIIFFFFLIFLIFLLWQFFNFLFEEKILNVEKTFLFFLMAFFLQFCYLINTKNGYSDNHIWSLILLFVGLFISGTVFFVRFQPLDPILIVFFTIISINYVFLQINCWLCKLKKKEIDSEIRQEKNIYCFYFLICLMVEWLPALWKGSL